MKISNKFVGILYYIKKTTKLPQLLSTIFLLCVMLQGCSALSGISALTGGGPELSVDTTLGDKTQTGVGQVGDTQDIQVQSLSGGITTNNTQDIPIEFMFLMILGWLLPSPQEIWKGFLNTIKTIRGQ